MSRITLKFFPVTPQTLLTTENLCFKQKSNFSEKVLPLNVITTTLQDVQCAQCRESGVKKIVLGRCG